MALMKVRVKATGRILMVNPEQAKDPGLELVIEKSEAPKDPPESKKPETPEDPPKHEKKDLKGTKVKWTDSKGKEVTGTFESETDDPNIINVKKDGATKTQKVSADKVTVLNSDK